MKQIVGGSFSDGGAGLRTNFVSERSARWYAELYRRDGLEGGHLIMLGPGNQKAAREALAAGGGVGLVQVGEEIVDLGGLDRNFRLIEPQCQKPILDVERMDMVAIALVGPAVPGDPADVGPPLFLDGLGFIPFSRTPRKLDGDGEAHLIALACGAPPDGQDHWTLRLLADRMVELRYADSLSHETVRTTLKKTRSSRG